MRRRSGGVQPAARMMVLDMSSLALDPVGVLFAVTAVLAYRRLRQHR
jgi:hypothetical protein